LSAALCSESARLTRPAQRGQQQRRRRPRRWTKARGGRSWGLRRAWCCWYLIRFFLEIYHFFHEILRTFTGIFLRLLRSEYSFSVGGTTSVPSVRPPGRPIRPSIGRSNSLPVCPSSRPAGAYPLLHAKYESVEMYFAFLTKETALLFDLTHGRQVSNKS
jgi:hypothetical protein